jgi:hypothetical protein
LPPDADLQCPAEQVRRQAEAEVGGGRVVARPLVAQESVIGVECVPGLAHPGGPQGAEDGERALKGDVRVRPAPGEHQLAGDLAVAGKAVVVLPFAQRGG